jgi:hypothetical protein
MSIHRSRPSQGAALVLGGLLCFTACDRWHLSINADGLVFISVIGDYDGQPRDRFRVRVRESDGAVRVLTVPASGQLSLKSFTDGPLELTLLHPEGCHVAGANPRTFSVAAGEEVEVDFDVRCGG